jgi:energy-converting hydrogenase Eha subunit C
MFHTIIAKVYLDVAIVHVCLVRVASVLFVFIVNERSECFKQREATSQCVFLSIFQWMVINIF